MRLRDELDQALLDAGSMTWQITWNYTTVLNIIFLPAAPALLVRLVRSGSAPMLKMMGGSPAEHERHTRDHSQRLDPVHTVELSMFNQTMLTAAIAASKHTRRASAILLTHC
jgi:hypothetical protein